MGELTSTDGPVLEPARHSMPGDWVKLHRRTLGAMAVVLACGGADEGPAPGSEGSGSTTGAATSTTSSTDGGVTGSETGDVDTGSSDETTTTAGGACGVAARANECTECLEQRCCDEMAACAGFDDCGCVVTCLGEGDVLEDCYGPVCVPGNFYPLFCCAETECADVCMAMAPAFPCF